MRVIEIYEKGGFPKLVLESKKEFAAKYGLQSEYWRHFDVNESPEVLSYLKSNLKDLANHYHAQYQNAELAAEKPANYAEALRWYREYLASFPKEAETPADQLPARGPAARERGLRRGGARVRAHGLRLPGARQGGGGRLCRDLRAPRAPEGRRRASSSTVARTRHRRELAPLRRHVPEARARRGGARRGRRRPVRDEGLPPGDRSGAEADRALSGRRAGDPALGLDRRRALLARARRVPAGRAGLRQVLALTPQDDAGRRRWSTTSPPRSTSRASRRTRRRTIARPPITSCASSRRRRRRRSAPRRSTTRAPR